MLMSCNLVSVRVTSDNFASPCMVMGCGGVTEIGVQKAIYGFAVKLGWCRIQVLVMLRLQCMRKVVSLTLLLRILGLAERNLVFWK